MEIELQPQEGTTNLASGIHGEIATTISGFLFLHLRNNKVGRVFDGRTTFEISPDQPKREPDVSFVAIDRLPQNVDDTIRLAPDLAVEIISSNDDWKEVIKKAVTYLQAGVKLVWVVDPYTQSVFVFRPARLTDFEKLTGDQELDGETVIPGFKLKVRTIFEEAGPLQTGL